MTEFSIVEEWQKQIPLEIPALWQVVYFEGIHGHHILFSPSDLEYFSNSSSGLSTDLDLSAISDLGFSLLHAVSYREIVDTLEGCSLAVRAQIFRLYKSWLEEIGQQIKTAAN